MNDGSIYWDGKLWEEQILGGERVVNSQEFVYQQVKSEMPVEYSMVIF